jgi:hypothetical protein
MRTSSTDVGTKLDPPARRICEVATALRHAQFMVDGWTLVEPENQAKS